jgi:cyclic pyranopterin phosphate synthase
VTRDLAYSPLKAVRHLDVVQAVRDGDPWRPVHVQLILSDLCNQACGFCAYRDPSYSSSQLFYEIKPGTAGLRRDQGHPERNYNPNRMIAIEKALEILNDCAELGVSGIQFTGGGEPTVHPDFFRIVGRAQALGMATSLVTNGVLLGKRFADGSRGDPAWSRVIRPMSWIRVSLDAGAPATYARIRNVPDWHFPSALAAIRQARAGRDLDGRGPVIGVGYVVTPDNWREVLVGARLAKESGADNIRISAQFSADDEALFAGFHEEAAILCRAAERELSDDSFAVINRFSEKLEDLKQKAPDYDVCGYQFFTTYIGADLNVYRCCVLAYNERGIIGSLKDRSFQDLWMSQERVDEMGHFDARGCDRCQFNGINRNLDYMLRPQDPPHSEFV